MLIRYLASDEWITVLVRPMCVVVAVTVVTQLILTASLRSLHLGAFAAATLLALILDPLVSIILLIMVSWSLWANIIRRRPIGKVDWPRATRLLNVVIGLILLFNIARVGLHVMSFMPFGSQDPAVAERRQGAPDIYVVMLDGYPRTDTLDELFGFDNRPFVDQLERLGLVLAEDSHSNYSQTLGTLTSLFNAQHLETVLRDYRGGKVTATVLQRYVSRGAAIGALKGAGYHVIALASGISSTNILSADEIIDTGEVNSFEFTIMKAGIVPRLLPDLQRDWIYAQQRERIRESFDRLAELAASPRAEPRFVFAHVMSPHAPIVFKADGTPVEPRECIPASCSPWEGQWLEGDPTPTIGAIGYLNTLVVEAIQQLITQSRVPPVIVVLSDHGSRYNPRGDRDEMLRNFFMSYTPGRPGLFPSNATPINLVPRLLNEYAGTQLPLAAEDSYVHEGPIRTRGYLPVIRWPQT